MNVNQFFTWLKDSGTQAMLVLIGTVAACIAAAAAIFYGRKSLSKKDLAQVEGNTAHLDEVRSGVSSLEARSRRQEEADALKARAGLISILASGDMSGDVPFPLRLSIIRESDEPNPSLTRVELYNEQNTSFGSFPCSPLGDAFESLITMQTMSHWFNGGTPVQMSHIRRLKLRVWMSMNGTDVYRDMGVILFGRSSGTPGYTLNGRV